MDVYGRIEINFMGAANSPREKLKYCFAVRKGFPLNYVIQTLKEKYRNNFRTAEL